MALNLKRTHCFMNEIHVQYGSITISMNNVGLKNSQLANDTALTIIPLNAEKRLEVKGQRTNLQRGASGTDTLEGSSLPVHGVLHLLPLLSCLRSPSFNLLLHLPLLLLGQKDRCVVIRGSSADEVSERKSSMIVFLCLL